VLTLATQASLLAWRGDRSSGLRQSATLPPRALTGRTHRRSSA
jgi:hypothetical protein